MLEAGCWRLDFEVRRWKLESNIYFPASNSNLELQVSIIKFTFLHFKAGITIISLYNENSAQTFRI